MQNPKKKPPHSAEIDIDRHMLSYDFEAYKNMPKGALILLTSDGKPAGTVHMDDWRQAVHDFGYKDALRDYVTIVKRGVDPRGQMHCPDATFKEFVEKEAIIEEAKEQATKSIVEMPAAMNGGRMPGKTLAQTLITGKDPEKIKQMYDRKLSEVWSDISKGFLDDCDRIIPAAESTQDVKTPVVPKHSKANQRQK